MISAPTAAVSAAPVAAATVSTPARSAAPMSTTAGSTAATPFRRNGWDRAGAWCGMETTVARRGAMLEPATIMVESTRAIEWTDAVRGSPKAVIEARAAVVIEVVAGPAAVISVISTLPGDTACQDDQRQTDRQEPREQARKCDHRGDTVLVLLVGHSSTPNGAPSGSAISASLPP